MRPTRRQLLLSTLATLAPQLAAAATAGFTLSAARIIVQVLIDGDGPHRMILDSGAEAGAVSATLAAALALPADGAMTTQYGESFPQVRASLSIGDGIVLADLPMIVIDPARDLGDAALAGLVPAALLTNVNCLIDFDGMTITRDDGLAAPDGFSPLSSSFSRPPPQAAARPYSQITIGPNRLQMLWDTGAQLTMSIPRAAAIDLGLWDDARPYAPERFGHIGGPDARVSRIVRAGPIALGAVSYDSALILLDGDGPAVPTVGLGLIATVDLFIDAPARTLYVKRNGRPVPAIGYDLSGLSLVQGQGQLEVADVGTGSPAAAAGLRNGDLVLDPATLAQAAALIDQPAGTVVRLLVQREAGPQPVSFTLTPYL